jgi:hypothetical protein
LEDAGWDDYNRANAAITMVKGNKTVTFPLIKKGFLDSDTVIRVVDETGLILT